MFDRGYATLGQYRGTPVRLHWTLAFGLLYVSGLAFRPGAWLGYVLIVLFHEMGHAFLARRNGFLVREIMIHGMGGHCAYVGYPTQYQQAIIATGGILAQLMVLALALPAWLLLPDITPHVRDLLAVLVFTNLWMIGFNLIPIQPLDGHLIFQLPGLYAKAERERAMRAYEEHEARERNKAARARAKGASSGVEPVDEKAVKDLVKKALEDAKRAAKDRQN